MTKEFKVLKDCYYGEPREKHKFIKAGDIYKSETLTAEKAPKYFQLISKKVETPKAPSGEKSLMAYNDMKKFVVENDIETADMKGPTLEAAIKEFLAKKADLAKEQAKVEAEGEQVAADLKQTPAAPLTGDNAPEQPITNQE